MDKLNGTTILESSNSRWANLTHVHHVMIPDDIIGGRYRQVCSMNAFHERLLEQWTEQYRKLPGLKNAYLVNIPFRRESDHITEPREYAAAQHVYHTSLWAFYKHIGYDHKANNAKDFVRVISGD